MPLSEFPFDGSWDIRSPVSTLRPALRHAAGFHVSGGHPPSNGIGVILDWVPAHFQRTFSPPHFDGTHLTNMPIQGRENIKFGHPDFQFRPPGSRCFLLGSAMTWFDRYHIDGLRVDAVAALLYLDFLTQARQWIPNKYGGRRISKPSTFFVTQTLRSTIISRRPHDCRGIDAWGRVTRPAKKAGGL